MSLANSLPKEDLLEHKKVADRCIVIVLLSGVECCPEHSWKRARESPVAFASARDESPKRSKT